jgi:hypothetical protein
VLEHAGAAVHRIKEQLEFLQRTGGLQMFNQHYRARRIAAEAAGQKYMGYGVAMAKLRRALAGAAAGSGLPNLAEVLDVPPQRIAVDL